jgi:ubiquinone/menaquinone biosynthesis C-methylase UbiE
MDTRQAYNEWATQYDTNLNRTRDLEARALRATLEPMQFESCLEIGCGTGKNTVWLQRKAQHVTAVDLSEEMLAKAKAKIANDTTDDAVRFVQVDITAPWTFRDRLYDLVTFSLVLEHIADMAPVFREVAASLKEGGYVYIGELHPFKQYAGSKARFETASGTQVVDCFNHHVSDFTHLPHGFGLVPVLVNEYFDDDDRSGVPRILTVLLKKTANPT